MSDIEHQSIQTNNICTACGGIIIEETFPVYNPESGPIVYGPASKGQFRTVNRYYCGECGILYHKLPKRKN